MRSLENQRYSIRSANNGISAVISTKKGEIMVNIGYEQEGIIKVQVSYHEVATPLSKYGYDILYIIMFVLFLVSAVYYNFRVFRR